MAKHNRVMIYCPKDDGSYLVEFRTAEPCIPDDSGLRAGPPH